MRGVRRRTHLALDHNTSARAARTHTHAHTQYESLGKRTRQQADEHDVRVDDEVGEHQQPHGADAEEALQRELVRAGGEGGAEARL